MIMRNEITCPCCDAEFIIEFDIEANPAGPEICPFCENYLPTDEELIKVDKLMQENL